MEIIEAIFHRRSVREYTDKHIDRNELRRLVDAAIQAPSAVNQQPWSFTVVSDQRLLDQISRESKKHMLATLPAGAASAHFRSILSDPNFHIFYHAPVLVVISTVAPSQWDVEDCALAAENLMLAAYAAGLGSCWIGFAQSWIGTREGKAALDLPAEYSPVAPIILGYPKIVPPPVPRKEPTIRWVG